MRPLVSIGMPLFNGASHLHRALDSILAQEYNHFELIISDNGSTDETEDICQFYAARDRRIIYLRNNHNRGYSWNFNHVLELAKGKYFFWATHDDVRAPSYINKCVDRMEKNEKAVLCQAYTLVYIEGMEIPLHLATMDSIVGLACPERRFSEVLNYLPATAMYGLLRTDIAKKLRPWGNYLSTDIVFTHELSLYGEFMQVPEELFFYYSRSQRRTPEEDYSNLSPGSRISRWYFPFLVIALQHTVSIHRSPLTVLQKSILFCILIRHEINAIAAKILMRAALFSGMKDCPYVIAKFVDQQLFHNPNIKRIMDESSIPFDHQRPSKQLFSRR